MRKKTNFLIYSFLLIVIFIVFANSCKKDDRAGIPELITTEVTNITYSTAKSGGNITSDGGSTITARGVCWSTTKNPTIMENKTTDSIGDGNFTSFITGLSDNTTYYLRAYATNSNGIGYGSVISFTTQQIGSPGSFTDPRDGTVYQTVTIGNQVWMAENLRYLPSVAGPGSSSQTTPYYYVYDYYGTSVNDAKATANYTTYGVLYNWPAAMAGSASSTTNPSGVQGVCPPGWHLPSDDEWTELTDYLGGEGIAGGKLKATTLWNSPNTGATNETGFAALPGGYFDYSYRLFNNIDFQAYWWSATDYPPYRAWGRLIYYNGCDAFRHYFPEQLGFSVRCVKD